MQDPDFAIFFICNSFYLMGNEVHQKVTRKKVKYSIEQKMIADYVTSNYHEKREM